jgi:hypothetical protein
MKAENRNFRFSSLSFRAPCIWTLFSSLPRIFYLPKKATGFVVSIAEGKLGNGVVQRE